MKIILASANENKASEIQSILREVLPGIEVSLPPGGMPDVIEDRDTFDGNAALKAEAVIPMLKDDEWALADDSGLVVDILKGKPGVYSKRYAGENASDDANMDKLLERMKDVPEGSRKACFVCCLILIDKNHNRHVFYGECQGVIATEKSGEHGFGYDPIFIPEEYDKSFGELGDEVKSKISHRAIALSLLSEWVKAR